MGEGQQVGRFQALCRPFTPPHTINTKVLQAAPPALPPPPSPYSPAQQGYLAAGVPEPLHHQPIFRWPSSTALYLQRPTASHQLR